MKKSYIKFLSLVLALMLALSLSVCAFASDEADAESSASTTTVKVGISWSQDVDPDDLPESYQAFTTAIELAGAEAVILPQITNAEEAEAALATVDALVMTGGEDVGPVYYGETEDPELEEVNAERDVSDYLLLKQAIVDDVPTLCICRGSQMLNVVCGGTLIQDIPTYLGISAEESIHRDPAGEDFVYDCHTIYIEKYSILYDIAGTTEVNMYGWHHQAVGELGEGLEVVAQSEDGIVEGTYMPEKTFIVGLQFHPEYMIADGMTEYDCYFVALVEAAQ